MLLKRKSLFIKTILKRPRSSEVFRALATKHPTAISKQFLCGFLDKNGFERTDPRLLHLHDFLSKTTCDTINLECFQQANRNCIPLMSKLVSNSVAVPDFQQIRDLLTKVYWKTKPESGGAVATYIPELAKADPKHFAISFTSVDGQCFSIGDSEEKFTIQSCSKPISYILALEQFGSAYVHKHVGMEPSGLKFNAMALKAISESLCIPHNPLINAGAIMSTSMLFPESSLVDRFEYIRSIWEELSSTSVEYDDRVYQSESATSHRNRALAHMMSDRNSWPACFDPASLDLTVELYLQICSLLMTTKGMSTVAATLANGGKGVFSGKQIFKMQSVQYAMPLMLTCGMYDYSGQWAFEVGVPAKSGVAGCIFLVVPNVGGFALWSPRLDENGNSVRGILAAKEIAKEIKIGRFILEKKNDVTKPKNFGIYDSIVAASEGRIEGIETVESDYDMRTPLHIAAAEGQIGAIKYLLGKCDVNAKDRWGGTPLDDAMSERHDECALILRENGAEIGHTKRGKRTRTQKVTSQKAAQILSLAARGDLDALVQARLRSDLFSCDYDYRTALHLAACNGHRDVVRYILIQAGDRLNAVMESVDRWGNTALDDSIREGRLECEKELRHFGACD